MGENVGGGFKCVAIDGGLQYDGVAGWQEIGLQCGWRLVNDGENGVSFSRGLVLWPGD